MATSIVENDTAAKFGNSPQKTGEPLDHAKLYSGKALEFDGVSDVITSGNNTLTNGFTAMTISCWIYVENDTDSMIVSSKGSGASSGSIWTIFYESANNNMSLVTQPSSITTDSAANSITLDTWHRLVVTVDYSAEEQKIYIDGVQSGSTGTLTDSALASDTTWDVSIGAKYKSNGSSTGQYWDGKLSDYQVWNTAWSSDDVTYDYLNPEKLITSNASVSGSQTTSNLKLWYPMNDTGVTNPQTVVFDAAGTNNTTKNHATTIFLGNEMLTNTGFETLKSGESGNTAGTVTDLFDDWTVSLGGSSTVEADTDVSPQAGTYAAKMLYNGGQSYIYQDATVVNGKNYTLSFYVRGDGSKSGHIRVHKTTGGDYIAEADIGQTAASWAQKTYTFTADADGDVRIRLLTDTAASSVWYDQVSFKETGITSGWTEADQQQTIPQTALMNGSSKMYFSEADGDGIITPAISGLITDSWTLSGWMWLAADQNSLAWNGFGIGNSYQAGFKIAGNRALMQTNHDSSGDVNLEISYSDDMVLGGQWAHICATHNATTRTVTVYKNGSSVGTGTYGSGYTPDDEHASANKIYIGEGSQDVTGIIDEVAVWKGVAFSEPEVTSLFNSGTPLAADKHSQASSLVGYWRNNHLTTDGKWEDLSTNDNHGVITGGTNKIFFQEGIQANLDTLGFNTNIDHPSNGAAWFSGSATTTGTSSYIDIGRDIEIEGDFMVMLWFKVPNTSTNYLFGYGNNDYFRISDEDSFLLKINNTTETIDLNGGTDIGVEQWHHIALTRTGATGVLKIYFDNVEQTATSATDTSTLKIRALMRKSTASGNYGYGMIDEFFIYDNFNENAISKNYNHGKSKHKNN